jgi:hypothetical protein
MQHIPTLLASVIPSQAAQEVFELLHAVRVGMTSQHVRVSDIGYGGPLTLVAKASQHLVEIAKIGIERQVMNVGT